CFSLVLHQFALTLHRAQLASHQVSLTDVDIGLSDNGEKDQKIQKRGSNEIVLGGKGRIVGNVLSKVEQNPKPNTDEQDEHPKHSGWKLTGLSLLVGLWMVGVAFCLTHLIKYYCGE